MNGLTSRLGAEDVRILIRLTDGSRLLRPVLELASADLLIMVFLLLNFVGRGCVVHCRLPRVVVAFSRARNGRVSPTVSGLVFTGTVIVLLSCLGHR